MYFQEIVYELASQCRRSNETDLDKLPKEKPNTRARAGVNVSILVIVDRGDRALSIFVFELIRGIVD